MMLIPQRTLTLHTQGITPDDCYYIISDDGYPIMPLRIYFKPVRENNLNILLGD